MEKVLSKNFKQVLKTYNTGDIVQYSKELGEAINNLESYLELSFCAKYRKEWTHQSLDGIYEGYVYKTGNNKLWKFIGENNLYSPEMENIGI